MRNTITNGEFGYRVTASMRGKDTVGAYAFQHWTNYQREVAKPIDEASGKQIRRCRKCKCDMVLIDGAGWVVTGTGTTADGLTYCPPNPDHGGRFGDHIPQKS